MTHPAHYRTDLPGTPNPPRGLPLPHRDCRCEWDGQLVAVVDLRCRWHAHLRRTRPARKGR